MFRYDYLCVVILFLLIPRNSLSDVSNDTFNSSLYCLAQNIYFEARGESDEGKYAVADVVLNRVNNNNFPNTICEVVKYRCSFSWVCYRKNKIPQNYKSWKNSVAIASNILYNKKYRGITDDSLYYHQKNIKPYWVKTVKRYKQIGNHIFYKVKK